MIRFANVHKSFGTKSVLNGLNLEVKKGEVFFILGGSGTGKSVALKSLVGLHRIDEGSITYDERAIEKFSDDAFTNLRKEISMVFQLPALLDSRNLLENMMLPIRHLGAHDRWLRIVDALQATNLRHYEKSLSRTFPTALSYGEQKRMALARSLVTQPKVLLYDEPTTGMDAETARDIHQLIRSVAGLYLTTSIVVSHDITNALRTADRLAVMNEGKAIFCGKPSELPQSSEPVIQAFLKASHQTGNKRELRS